MTGPLPQVVDHALPAPPYTNAKSHQSRMSAVVLAQMWDGDHMDGGWWWVMGVGWFVFLALVVLLGYWLIRHLTQNTTTERQPRRDAEDILAERLARGEIDEDEYRRRRDALRNERRPRRCARPATVPTSPFLIGTRRMGVGRRCQRWAVCERDQP
jgi:putative membrane protein